MEQHKLDNPVWYALGESHKGIAIDYGDMRFYSMPYANFGAIEAVDTKEETLIRHLECEPIVYLVGNLPSNLSGRWKVEKVALCAQMVCASFIDVEYDEETIVKLDGSHKQQLLDLIHLVQPGYFFEETQSLGQYYGIMMDGQLVAAAGERVRLHQFTEVSGVVTHPDFVKRGYATTLVAHATKAVLTQGIRPFLHVLATNSSAISIYQKLGYTIRRQIAWSKISKC